MLHNCSIDPSLYSSTTLFTEMANEIQQLVEMVGILLRSAGLMLIGIAQKLKGRHTRTSTSCASTMQGCHASGRNVFRREV